MHFPRDNSDFKSCHIRIIEKLFPGTSQHTNVAKTYAILRDISWYQYTCKNLNISYLFSYYITRSSAVITSSNPFTQWTSIWNVYSALQQQNNFEFWEMPPATQHDRIAQDFHEKKSLLM